MLLNEVLAFEKTLENLLVKKMKNNNSKCLGNVPNSNVYEDDNKIKVEMEIPGVRKEELDLMILNDVLTLKVIQDNNVDKDDGCIDKNKYGCSIKMPFKLSEENVTAKLEDGILELGIDKSDNEKAISISIN